MNNSNIKREIDGRIVVCDLQIYLVICEYHEAINNESWFRAMNTEGSLYDLKASACELLNESIDSLRDLVGSSREAKDEKTAD